MPHALLLGGGEHFSGLPGLSLEQAPLDLVVLGEGEDTAVDIAARFAAGGQRALARRLALRSSRTAGWSHHQARADQAVDELLAGMAPVRSRGLRPPSPHQRRAGFTSLRRSCSPRLPVPVHVLLVAGDVGDAVGGAQSQAGRGRDRALSPLRSPATRCTT
ncbi:MAG: hypothetical protein U1E76_23490 [Planctomycetota bacterium]